MAIRNSSVVYLISWGPVEAKRKILHSHPVASWGGKEHQEVTGYVNYNIGMEIDVRRQK